jgi:hypothetical protein
MSVSRKRDNLLFISLALAEGLLVCKCGLPL